MSTEELGVLYERLEELRVAGKEGEATAMLRERIKDLPQDVQDEIMLSIFIDSLRQEADGIEAVRELQEEGLKAANVLKKQKGSQEGIA